MIHHAPPEKAVEIKAAVRYQLPAI